MWQGLVGYRFNRYLGIEGSMLDFGDYGSDVSNADTGGYTAAVKGMIPSSEHFAVFVKGGQLWWESDYNVSGLTGDVDDESLFVGAEVNYAISQYLSINAEYTIYDSELDGRELRDNLGDRDFDTDFKQASVGVGYHF